MSFSERHGYSLPRTIIQTEGIDEPLKNGIWNVIYETFFSNLPQFLSDFTGESKFIVKEIWKDVYKDRIDEIPSTRDRILGRIIDSYFEAEWYWIYDFVELLASLSNFIAETYQDGNFTASVLDREETHKTFKKKINSVLEKEASGYRLFDDCKIISVIKQEEVQEIERALSQTKSIALNGVHVHLSSAIDSLSNRKQPDYRNVIKESILSVESLVKVISGEANADLSKALKSIERTGKVKIHKALSSGLVAIYGYSSDKNGIRHALLDEDDTAQEDAVFMLVSCSAFVNYLIAKAKRAEINLNEAL